MTGSRSIELATGVWLPVSEIELRASRSGGPGGQHANVTASRIEAVFDVDGSATLTPEQKRLISSRLGPRVIAVAQESRGQARNREVAIERLRRRLAEALRPHRKRRTTSPSRGARRRRLEAKRRTAQRKRERRKPGPEDW